jgi:hypothetical protein
MNYAPGDQGSGLASPAPGYQPEDSMGITAAPSGLMNYQGRLLQNDVPYDGAIDITFTLWSDSTAGSSYWQETQTVQVDDGLFNVMLGAANPLDGLAVQFQRQLWLGIQPAGAASELTPRQPMGTVAYAMNLMPGATIVDRNIGGSYGTSFYVSSDDHPAIYGYSAVAEGVRGSSNYTGTSGVRGDTYGNDGYGVSGWNYGDSTSCPTGETACAAGVYATAGGNAYAAFIYGENRSGIVTVQGDNNYYGLWLYSQKAPNGSGIWTNGASTFNDYVTFNGGKSGYVVDIALNDGVEPLEQGDVVVISGYESPVVGNIPVARVRRATGANTAGVMGVVDVLYVPCAADPESLQAGQACGGFETSVKVIQPGEYLSVVTLGAYAAIKVNATYGPIRPGDVLATSGTAGYAMTGTPLTLQGVTFYAPGTIIGTAMGALDKGTGTIPVFISSR